MVGLDEKLVQDFRQICIDFDGKILAHPKSHKQQLLLLPEITNHPELVPYVMSAEELADFQKLVDDLGNSLPMRRAFRLWLSSQLSDNSQEIEGFIKEAFSNSSIVQFWKDELLVSVLLSDYSESFFKFFENCNCFAFYN